MIEVTSDAPRVASSSAREEMLTDGEWLIHVLGLSLGGAAIDDATKNVFLDLLTPEFLSGRDRFTDRELIRVAARFGRHLLAHANDDLSAYRIRRRLVPIIGHFQRRFATKPAAQPLAMAI